MGSKEAIMNNRPFVSETPPITPVLKPASSRLGLAVLLLGGFLTVFDLFVVNVAIPNMQVDLGASFAEVGFVIAGYALSFGMFLIAGGRLGDAYGRRRLFAFGVLGFAGASLLCGLAPNTMSLIVVRFLQGAAGAILFPQIYALLRVMFDEAGRRRAFGLLGMTLGLAAIAGQVLGGLLVEGDILGLGWRIAFLVNVPIGLVMAVLSLTIPESRVADAKRVDWSGIGLAMFGLLLLLVPLLEGQNAGWPAWTWGCFAASIPVFGAFLGWERRLARRDGSPAVDLALFANGHFVVGSIVVLLIYSTSTSLFLCFALLTQSGLRLTPFQAGSLFAPASVGFVAASLVAPKLVACWGNGMVAGGALIYAAGIGWLVISVAGLGGAQDVLTLVPPLVLLGFGQGLSMTPLLNLVIGLIDERHAGMAAALISTMQQVGGAFGVAVVGIFFSSILGAGASGSGPAADRYAGAFAGAMLYNFAAVLLAALLVARIGCGWRPSRTKPSEN
jgi:EmrB/QacA subfamily drug resistance transporter